MNSNLMLSPLSLPRALRFRSLVANKDKRETRMTGEEAQGSMERRKNRGNFARFLLSIFLCAQIYIRHLHIFHNTPCLPPKFCITFVFHFSCLHKIVGGGGGPKQGAFWEMSWLVANWERETSKNEAAAFTTLGSSGVSLFCPRRA